MKELDSIAGYKYSSSKISITHACLLPTVERELAAAFQSKNSDHKRVFDVGCGNGSVAHWMTDLGYEVTGIDPSKDGIEQARESYPNLKLEIGSAYEDLAAKYGTFPAIVSLEVVEHLYAPRDYARTLFQLLEPGGTAILSTPYHGYWKNLALAITGQMDKHFHALWDHGHIKFWSIKTLGSLLREAGFDTPRFHRVGRIPPLAMSMIAVAKKPKR